MLKNNQLEEIKSIDIPIIVKLVQLFNICEEEVLKLPKFSKNTLGEKILNNILNILELSFKATICNKYEKEQNLLLAQAKNELLKVLIRIIHQRQYIDQKKYLEIQCILNEIGRMLSGWIKYARNN